MNRRIFLCALGVSGLGAAAGVSFAAGAEADARFKRMDLSGDGRISSSEYANAAKSMFFESDTDHDGVLTLAEVTAAEVAQRVAAEPARAAISSRTDAASRAIGTGGPRADGT